MKIVVGVDGSSTARRALEWAVEEARARDASLEVVHAWHVAYPSAPLAPIPYDPELYQKAARELLDDELDAVDTRGLQQPVTTLLVEGTAAQVLLTAAEDADLVVVGSRGHGGFVGLLLGSTSNQVSHHCACPIVIVPSAPRTSAHGDNAEKE